jgi:branched-subunit amino acid ABC-type transport system permease component
MGAIYQGLAVAILGGMGSAWGVIIAGLITD